MWPFKKRPKKPLAVRRARFSFRLSFWLHVWVIGFIAYECLMLVSLPMPLAPEGQQIALEAEPLAPPEPPPVEINAYEKHPENWLAKEAVDTAFLEQAHGEPRFTEFVEDIKRGDEQTSGSNFLADKVMQSIAEAKEHSQEDQLDRLKNLSNQVTQVSTEERVADISQQISKFLGQGQRATAPTKEPVPGEFDSYTGQLHDMRREMKEDGTFKYFTILLDSAGRSMEVELTAAEGESAYKAFELMKQNPLLERVYRGVIMSTLDGILKPRP